MKAPVVTLIALALALTSCEAPDAPSLEAQAMPQQELAPTEPAPSPTPSPAPVAIKGVLSSWVRSDGRFTVDFTALTDGDASVSGISATGRADFRLSDAVACMSEVVINGTESLGTLNVVRTNSGSQSTNDRYCNDLLGTHDYAAMNGNQLRTCKSSICYFWN